MADREMCYNTRHGEAEEDTGRDTDGQPRRADGELPGLPGDLSDPDGRYGVVES